MSEHWSGGWESGELAHSMGPPVSRVPATRVINIADARLNGCFLREPERFASVSEYATATGIDTATVIDLLGPYLDEGTLALEVYADEIFIHTAPKGRGSHIPTEVRPNLWERLRDRAPVERAYGLWRLIRDLERSGWRVETLHSRIMFGLGAVEHRPSLGIEVGATVVPLLIHPLVESLAAPDGLLTEYHRAGAPAVGITCDQGALDETITAVRRWILSHPVRPSLHALILEAPRYNPTHLRPNDAAVTPHAVTRHTLDSLVW